MNATTFAALGETSRLDIVELLRRRPFTVGGISEALGIRQPQVSKHLKVLRDAGVVDVEPAAQKRIYHLRPAAFAEVADWVGSFDVLWEQRLDSLGDVLAAIQHQRQEASSPTDNDKETT